MSRKLIIAASLAIASAFAAPAMANDVTIDQFGFGNSAGGGQTGWNNKLGVFQDGVFNNTIIEQFGSNNTA
ncbi:MAG: curlin, partial [Roseitalea sp.]|nr:curlin [Roseitalea sp.]